MADDEKQIEETEETVEAEAQAEEVSDTTDTFDEAATVEEVSDTGDTVDEAATVEEVSDTPTEPPAEQPTSEAPAEEPAAEGPPAKTKSLRHVPRPQRRQRSRLVREKPATSKPISLTEKP